jgi:phage baseplate assembly protein W
MADAASETALLIPFALDDLGNIAVTTSQEAIWAGRVRSALGTRLGERVMRPSYGTKAGEALFDTVSSTTDLISREVQRVFHEQLPLLNLDSVETSLDEFENVTTINVSYQLPNQVTSTASVGTVVVSSTNPTYEELL